MVDPEFLRHGYRQREAASLERARRQPAFILDDDVAGAEPLLRMRQMHERGDHLAQRDTVFGARHREEFAIAPEAFCTRGERLF